ncbi:MAG: hypothetical protein J6O18_01745, partial [Bacilli bacterium]|nr:hypothetical protein [Bacilli bacterium]
MDCDIKVLSKAELDLLLESVPRKAYLSFCKPKQVIVDGFRDINKIPEKMFFANLRKLIEKDQLFVANFNKFLTEQRDNYFKRVEKYENEDGFDHISAYSKVIQESISEKYRPLFLKVFGEDENDAKAILRTIESEKVLECKIKSIVTPLIPEPDKRTDSLSEEITQIKAELSKIAKQQKEAKEASLALHDQLRAELLEKTKDYITKTESSIASLRNTISKIEKKAETKTKTQPVLPTKEIEAIMDSLESLSKRIGDLEQTLVASPAEPIGLGQPSGDAVNPFEIISVPEVLDIDVSDEDYIGDNILDVAKDRIPHGAADLYREAVLEYIYSDRPIVAAGASAKHLVEEISGVLTGQMYSRIKLVEHNFTYADLMSAVKTTCATNEISVVLVEGVLGKGDLSTLFRRLKGVAPKAKFVFALPETRFVKFLDPSVFEECLYFGGKFEDTPAAYAYQTSISEHFEVDIPECDAIRDSLGIRNAFSYKLHQNEWRGLVAYC